MIPDEEAERAIAYMRDTAKPAAKANADRHFVLGYRKIVVARIMKEHEALSLGAQEREAYADQRFEEHLKAETQAIETADELEFLRLAADRKTSVWQTIMKHIRG